MRLTKLHLKRLIQEELEKAAEETKSDSTVVVDSTMVDSLSADSTVVVDSMSVEK